MGGAPSVTTHAGFSATSREPSASALGDLRVTVRAFPPGQSPRTFHSSRSSCSVRLPGDSAVPSHGVSFGAPLEDQMSIAASGDGQSSSEDENSAGLPPSGVKAAAICHRSAAGQAPVCSSPWAPPVSSRAASPRAESSPRPARRASRRSTAPPVFQLAPISSREAKKRP